MSRASVRAAVTAYLQPPHITGLNAVLRTKPKDFRAVEWTSGAPGEVSGAVGVVFIERQSDSTPQAFDGHGGGRVTTYTVVVLLFHRSAEPDAGDAMDHFDSVVDALCTRLRSDPTLGLGNDTAMAQGLLSGAHEGLDVEFGEPELGSADGGLVETWAGVRFPVLEWNQPT